MNTRRAPFAVAVLLLAFAASLPRAAFDVAQARQQPPASETPEYGPPKGTLRHRRRRQPERLAASTRSSSSWPAVPTRSSSSSPPRAATATRRDSSSPTTSSGSSRRGCGSGSRTSGCCTRADPKVADTEEFAKVLRDADAVWFNGGRQWNIVDSYANTLTYREFHKVLERGGVIGGSSAGATIQGEYLVRGDTSGADVMMTPEPNHQEALQVPAPRRHRSAHQHAQPLGPSHPGHPEVPDAARHRAVRSDGDHRQGGSASR